MKITAKIDSPGDVGITITVLMPLAEWKVVAKTLADGMNHGSWSHTSQDLVDAIRNVVSKISTTVESGDVSTSVV